MNLLASSQMLSAMEMYLAEVTERQIEREGTKLDKKESGDKELGVLQSEFAKRLWCAHKTLRSKGVQAMARSKEAVEDHEEKALEREYRMLDDLADICREWVWHEIRQSIGDISWDNSNIGIRTGWVVVVPVEKKGPLDFLKQLGIQPPDLG